MKISGLYITFIPLLVACSAFSDDNEDYAYIETPVAAQIADLADDDNDGVINARDKCPDTAPSSKIDNDGCSGSTELSDVFSINVLFANDSSEIPTVFVEQIQQMAEFLKKYPETSIELEGYASKVGREEYNLALSKMRSNRVRDLLIELGIDPSRVTSVGHGESVLVAEGDDEISHAQNRHVAARVIGMRTDMIEEWTIFTTLPSDSSL